MKKLRCLFTVILCVTPLWGLFAEHEFALSLAPVLEIPSGKEHFGPGAGGAAAFDWAFLPFMGLSAGGAFSSLPVAAGSAFTVYRGGGKIKPGSPRFLKKPGSPCLSRLTLSLSWYPKTSRK
jgi:hypothetical protein